MAISSGQIVTGLVSDEPVQILKIQQLGDKFSIQYCGVHSKQVEARVLDKDELEKLQVISDEGEFNFSGNPEFFLLYAEAQRIESAYQFDPLFAMNCSIVDPLPHQIEAVYKNLLPMPQIRFLLADDTGAGKTIMTGLLIKEMLMRGYVDRIIIITPGGLTKQWQEDELGFKFNLQFKLVNRSVFYSDPMVFQNSNRIIVSLDFLRQEDVLNVVKETSWDMIIVDEAHKLSAFDYGQKKYVSKRYRALEMLTSKSEHVLLLTATPHRGRKDTFRNLLQLLDSDIFSSDALVTSRIKRVEETGANKFFIRRLKEEMKDWDGNQLFKERYTKTVTYHLTPEEKRLYDEVTSYLQKERSEARRESNIHVSLALMVMQRRLTSSIYAIMKTLKNRHTALQGILDELISNPNLWQQRIKLEYNLEGLEDFDELNDEERESLESIFSDPKKFKLFTTAKSISEIRQEAEKVKRLVELAESLYYSKVEEQKLKSLQELLSKQGALDANEKLVIFTEHKDTLDYLEGRLKNQGYTVVTIHGSKSVEERRQAQDSFSQDTQILVATDAAGEGINLQFCRYLINWDIPWNPNRLEQRMGRIHRYGQVDDVIVFNMVARNTREGVVLKKLLDKMEVIREQMGNDRVYDVISDIFEEISMEDIISSTFEGVETDYDAAIEDRLTRDNIEEKIKAKKEELATSVIDYKDARELKDQSDEKRLQPIYIRLFFEKSFKALGGQFTKLRESIYQINNMPSNLSRHLREEYNFDADCNQALFCIDKRIFLEHQKVADSSRMYYINPGNPIFDSLVALVLKSYREDMLRGTTLISPMDKEPFYGFLVRSQIVDASSNDSKHNLADENLILVCGNDESDFNLTSPAKLIDLHPPNAFAKKIEPHPPVSNEKVVQWGFSNHTLKQFEQAEKRINKDIGQRIEYLEESFSNMIMDLTATINELQAKLLLGDMNNSDKINKIEQRITQLNQKKQERIEKMHKRMVLKMKPPEVLGCAYVQPLSQVEYKQHFGMSRDDDVERIAMQVAMQYESQQGRLPADVSAENVGFDIRSVDKEGIKRYIEVKGRSGEDGVMLTENEMNRLSQLGENAWLYIVVNCKTEPLLYRAQNPAKIFKFEPKPKGIQFFLAKKEWLKYAEPANNAEM